MSAAAQDIAEKLEEQESRQAELNHYVQMVRWNFLPLVPPIRIIFTLLSFFFSCSIHLFTAGCSKGSMKSVAAPKQTMYACQI